MKDYKKNKNNFCWLFLRASLGEFHALVPELIYFAEQENLLLRISFVNDKIKKQFFDNLLYRKLAERYFEVVERKDILTFAQRNKKNIKYLFREMSGLDQYSVTRSLRILLPGAKLILFPHAFAPYFSKSFNKHAALKIPTKKKSEDCVDGFIIFTEDDKDFFKNRFPPEMVTVFTPRGLSEEWFNKLQSTISKDEIKAFKRETQPKRILFTLRAPHPVFLSEKNYFELLEEVIEVVEANGYELFLKPHPRQNLQSFLNYCETHNLQVWTNDTYTSALFFDKVITFWSSASIDFAAFGIPTIEHFRYEKYHTQLIEVDGKLSSLYVNMGISLPSTTKEELEVAFRKMIEDPQKIGNEQQKNLVKTYNNPQLELDRLRIRKPRKFSFLNKVKHYARLYYYISKNK